MYRIYVVFAVPTLQLIAQLTPFDFIQMFKIGQDLYRSHGFPP